MEENAYNLLLRIIANSPKGSAIPTLDTLDGTEKFFLFKGDQAFVIAKDKITFPGEVPDSILDFVDTPSTFTGQKGKILVVKQDETGLEYKVLAEVTGVSQATFDLLEDRVAAIEAGGGESDPTVDHEYPTIPDMIAGQNAQLADDIIKVLDASAAGYTGKAYYFYDGTTAGTLEDYTLLTKEEVTALTSQQITTALGYTPANDSEVIKVIRKADGTIIPPDVNREVTLPEFGGAFTTDESLYLDPTTDVLRANVSTYSQTLTKAGSQVFTLDFEPTNFVMVHGRVTLFPSDYIFTPPTTFEVIPLMADGEKVRLVYERFIEQPS